MTLAGDLTIAPIWHSDNDDDEIFIPSSVPRGTDLVTRINQLDIQGGNLITAGYFPAAQPNRLEIKTLSGQGTFEITTQLVDGWEILLMSVNMPPGISVFASMIPAKNQQKSPAWMWFT